MRSAVRLRPVVLVLLSGLAAGACGFDGGSRGDEQGELPGEHEGHGEPDGSGEHDGGAPDAAPVPSVFGGDRPVTLQLPDGHDPARAYPLLVILHGYAMSGATQQAYFGMEDAADRYDALVLAPDGTADPSGLRFWNASDACCDMLGSGVDDLAYVGGLIDEVRAAHRIERVVVVGLSSGAFMGFRLACERADVIDGLVAVAGAAAFMDDAACVPSRPVPVLAIHGTADTVIPYLGGVVRARFPGAAASIDRWARYDGCAGARVAGDDRDLVALLPGGETRAAVSSGCPADGAVELWTVRGGIHMPIYRAPGLADAVWSWLVAHAR